MSDDHLTKTTAVPNWMVQLGVSLLGILGAGAVATLVSVVNWGFHLQAEQGRQNAEHKQDIGLLRAEMAANAVKMNDFNSMLTATAKTVSEIDRKVDRIEARMP